MRCNDGIGCFEDIHNLSFMEYLNTIREFGQPPTWHLLKRAHLFGGAWDSKSR